MENKNWILHIDGDSFFASCEVSRRPGLFGKPVVVGEERGIATALTYQAKALGVKRGDPIFKIRKEFPQVTILSSHFELYMKFAKNLQNILEPLVDKFEPYSIDEVFCEIAGTEEEVKVKVTKWKEIIQKKLGITYSFGVSVTKTLAKVASKKNKPNGICFLMNKQDIKEALKATKVESIWGVGWATDRKLKVYKIKTAEDFVNSDLRQILRDSYTWPLVQTVEELLGIRHYGVGMENAHKKSIQATRSFLKKTSNKFEMYGELSRNIETMCSQLRESSLVTKYVYVYFKPKNRWQKRIEKPVELPNYTASDITVLKYVEQMFDEDFNKDNIVYKKSGVVCYGLKSVDELQVDLFGEQENILKEESKVTEVVDILRNRYGFGSVCLASSIGSINKRQEDYERRHKKDVYEAGLPYPFLGVTS
jgi:DNA polymerase-4/DNA polymerase V